MISKYSRCRKRRRQTPRPERARSSLDLLPVLGDYLAALVDAFLSAFFSLRSSLFGLHFSQDLPSLCAATQHLCLHSLPSASAFSQQVCFFSGLSAAPTRPP